MNEYSNFNGSEMTNIPRWMKLILVFIDRVGFPVLAFILMFFMCYQSLDKATVALEGVKTALVEMSATNTAFQARVAAEHKIFETKLEGVKDKTYGAVRGIAPSDNYK